MMEGHQSNNKSILIVDDEKPIREILRQILEHEGYTVVTAANGQEGLDRLKESSPSLILLDTRMPIMDGWEFKKELEADPEFRKIPVFAFTAFAGIEPPGMNATGCIPKPFDIDELLNTLKPYLH